MIQTFKAAAGRNRTWGFRIKGRSGFLPMDQFQSVTVVVDGPDGSDIYTAECPQAGSDPTTRLVTVKDAATATANVVRNGCVHWVDEAGEPDADPFRLVVFEHA